MTVPIQHGYLVLADISGFTSFLAKSELDHAQDILRSILTLLIAELTPTLELAEVEGDAIFVHASASKISRGELLLELLEATYVAFRDRQRTMEHNATCPCNACHAISTLDLKFITHHGDYVLQNVGGTNKPVGSSVNLVHRMLKNGVREATGWRGYALFSGASLDHMGVHPERMHEGVETYEHLGTVRTYSINLDARYRELMEDRRMFLPPEEADIVLTHVFSAPPPIVWDWVTNLRLGDGFEASSCLHSSYLLRTDYPTRTLRALARSPAELGQGHLVEPSDRLPSLRTDLGRLVARAL
jgi:hypothetical protein